MNSALLSIVLYGAVIGEVGAEPPVVRRITLPNTIGHFDHVAASDGVAFLATKSNVSFKDEEGEVTAVRYDSKEHSGVIATLPIKGCNPQGIVVTSPGTIVTACDSSGDVAVLGWDGAALSLKGKITLAGGDSDDVWIVNKTLVLVSMGDDADDPAALAYVSIEDPTAPSVIRKLKTGGHPEAFRPLRNGMWAVNVPDLGQIKVVDDKTGAEVRSWDMAAGGCSGGNYAMAIPIIGGVEYIVVACRAKPKAQLFVWRSDDMTKQGPKAVVPKPLCTLRAYDQCDDLHATAEGAVYAAMGTSPAGYIMKYGPKDSKDGDACPLQVEWEEKTPGTGSRTCELDESGNLLVISPSPGGYNGTARGDAYLSVYKVEPKQQGTSFIL